MKKVLFFVLALAVAAPCFAGQFVVKYPDEQQGRIIEGLTVNGAACNEGEALGPCAKRIVVQSIKEKVRLYEYEKALGQVSVSEVDAI